VVLLRIWKLGSLRLLDKMLLALHEWPSLTRIGQVRSILYLPSLTQSQTACSVHGFYSLTNGSNIIADSIVLGSTFGTFFYLHSELNSCFRLGFGSLGSLEHLC